jgi:polyisoprenoid-binding protein YceI
MKNKKLSVFTTITITIALTLSVGNLFAPHTVAAQAALYKSCENDKLTAPLTLPAANAATPAATQASTAAADQSAVTPGADNYVFLSIVGSESQACYLTAETFLQGNFMGLPSGFNGAVGITQSIAGDVALDINNVANSKLGDITINVSEFKSDNDRRDGFLRQNYLESNKYPYATLKNVTLIGLPAQPYKEGDMLQFQVRGTLTVHNTPRDTTFDASGSYKSGVLVVHATTQLNMTDFGFDAPDIGGLLKVQPAMMLELNLVARESTDAATPVK